VRRNEILVDEWMSQVRDALAEAANIPASDLELASADVATLLDLAAVAAHESDKRTNAPLLCYLVGKAERTTDLATLAAAVRRAQLGGQSGAVDAPNA
jgi:Domain of unknown function (DUF6457)